MIRYNCGKCGSEMMSPDSLAGTTDFCPDCGAANTVPEKPRPAPPPAPLAAPPSAPSPADEAITVACPGCGVPLRLRGATAGAHVRCGACQGRFTLTAGADGQFRGQADVDGAAGEAAAPGEEASAAPGPLPFAVNIDAIVVSLTRALSLKKLGLYWLLMAATFLVAAAIQFGAALTGNPEVAAGAVLVSGVLGLGMAGVAAGGLARMTHLENQRRGERFVEALAFSLRHFHSLFGAALMLGVVLLLLFGMVNGMAYLLNRERHVGSLVAAVFYLPQYLLNAAGVLCFLAMAVMFCAMAVENVGAFRGLARLGACVLRRPRELLIQIILVMVFGVIAGVFVVVALTAVGVMTDLTNGPAAFSGAVQSLWQGKLGAAAGIDNAGSAAEALVRSPRSGDWLRLVWKGLIGLVALSYPAVYGVVAFTGFYERLAPQIRRRR